MTEGKPTRAKWWSRPRPSDDLPDGDYTLAGPRPAADPGTPGADEGDHGPDRPAPAPATAAGPEVPADGTPPPAPVAARPRPLHDPDPYGTPPYGEPGPWAPAPPVQHPAAHGTATPAHGTAAPALPQAAPFAPPAPMAPTAPLPASAAPPTAPSAEPGAGPSRPACAPPTAPPAGPPPGHAPEDRARDEWAHGAGAPGERSPEDRDRYGDRAHPAAPAPAGPPPAPAVDPWQRYDPWAPPVAAEPLQQTGAAVPTRDQRRRRARTTLAAAALVIAVASGVAGGVVGAYLERNGGIGAVELPQAGREPDGRAADSVAGIAARALPSVVTLHVRGSDASGTGTGFVLDDRGHILTNNHVVEPAGTGGEITVTFHSGDTAEATVVGRDSGYDLAVVRVRGVKGMTPLPLGNSDNVRVGDPVVAIGAPFDLAGTVTSGIISARERPITAGGDKGDGSDVSYVDALQTDAPINPGNSGGPLLDARGRAIGINSAIRSADGGGSESDAGRAGSIGLGFAIPINQGKRVAEELINTGRATHPVIGITLDMSYSGDGARVSAEGGDGGSPVTAGGPGAAAGIRSGDVITEVDGQRVHSGEELIVKIRAHRPGDRLDLTLLRDGDETRVSLVLGSSGGG
ncbi:S1C family serine protease [Streptomyces sp. TP-A0875]|uniref:S1C family serine protease n=1 Tax=Streptomyces sp. TP-A0875 TaxID=552354 RepID=UPI0006B6973C|nr:trypsin-like peptidase domain-containing protein [Streptomyces sp. TP-A0875]